jgi:hypothetical protein
MPVYGEEFARFSYDLATIVRSMSTAIAMMLATAMTARADTIEKPTVQHGVLRGSSRATGSIDLSTGFPAHLYTASQDGFVSVVLAIARSREYESENAGMAWRPYLRIVSVPSPSRRADGWSTNGVPGDAKGARAELVLRVHAGEQFTIVTTLAQNLAKGRPAAHAEYVLVVTEAAP